VPKAMTPPQRLAAVLKRKKPDRVPVIPFIQAYAANVAGIPLDEFWSDGDRYFDANLMSMRLHGYEQSPLYGYAACGPWEFGGRIRMPQNNEDTAPAVIENPVKTIDDIDRLEVPTFNDKLPGAYAIADKTAERCVALDMPAGFQVGSVFSAAAQVAETTQFLTWVMSNPEAVHRLMEKVSDMFVNALTYFADKYGAANCMPFQAGPMEANGIISPDQFKELVYPYNLKVNQKIRELGIQTVLMHPCGNQNLNIPYYVQMRQSCDWHGRYIWIFGPEIPIANQMKAFGEKDIICGNVDTLDIIEKPYEDLLDDCKTIIEAGKFNPGGFILAPGCEFPADAAPAKVMALIDAAEQFGRYC